jgi:acetyl esterase/lipase
MAIFNQLDPEIAPIIAAWPNQTFANYSDLLKARAEYHEIFLKFVAAPPDPRVAVADVVTTSRGEHPPVRLRIFRPRSATGVLPAIFWTQGGGYIMTSPDLDDAVCQDLAVNHGCIVASVEWRRAPEHPFPAASEDCYTGLSWVVAQAANLDIDPRRIVIAGSSSGGGSTASLALLVRDRAEFGIAHQMLIYPMLDDRNDTPSAHLVTDGNVWNRVKNEFAWRAFLGETYGTDEVSPYAVPSRMQNLEGSIPASILTSELDLFRDENILYAMRLMAAGVQTELYVYPRAPHGFDRLAPKAAVSQQFFADQNAILRRVFGTKL